ncbi:MAG: hypothetical protein KGM46_12395 [Pseudomonadota bacterium]|nr:hypothetical protein [Xanthomonadaceae bacterium]MDE2249077.1 hypothetical protein [Xanthomonadaceae bacterium]MDE3211531.1 hypothetical protein [Pseudomonadota bacterium]
MSRFPSIAPRWRVGVLATVCVAVALMVCALWYSRAAASAAGQGRTSDGSDGVAILRGLAEQAFADHHLVAPIGSNVYEFYLSVLQLDPTNSEALARLKQSFQPACSDVESAVGRGDLDEADRELRLLRDFDANRNGGKDGYKLELLGSYLAAQRHILQTRHEMQARLIQERQSAQDASTD